MRDGNFQSLMKLRKGFTLVEVLVSTALLAGIVLLLAVVLQGVQITSSRGAISVELAQRGRALAELMGNELADALQSPQFQFVINPPLPTGASAAPGADSLFFQVLSAGGQVAVVGYYLGSDHALRRVFIPSDSVLFSVFSQAPSKAVPWLQDPSIYDVDQVDGRCVIIAEGVAGFWVRAVSSQSGPLPGEGAARLTEDTWGSPLKFDSSYKVVANRIPSRVEIALTLVDSKSQKRIEAQGLSFPDVQPTADFNEETLQNSVGTVEQQLVDAGADGLFTVRKFVQLNRGSL